MRAPLPRGRRGFAVAVVAGLILLIALVTFVLQDVSRARYREAHRYAHGEVAMALAESGMNVALEVVAEQALVPGTEVHDALVEAPAEGADRVLQVLEHAVLEDLAGLFSGATIELGLELRGFRRLLPVGDLRGFVTDGREKVGELALVSRARYRGVTRTLRASRRVRVVQAAAPVLGKFTLFLRRHPGGDLNLLAYDHEDPEAGFRLEGEAASPLVLYHRPERTPAVVDGRFDPLGLVLEDHAPDAGGLVFLGGADPWYLNLVHGVGAHPYEELHHLRRTRYALPTDLPGGTHEYGLTFGFYEGVLDSEKFGAAAGVPGAMQRPSGASISAGTAALHLYGDTDHTTPTPVLGPVFRSYVTLRLLDGLWFPYATPEEFAAFPDRERFGGSYAGYSRLMARVVSEAYNRSYDCMATNLEALGDDGLVTAEGTPFVPGATLLPEVLGRLGPALDGDRHFLYPRPGQPAPGLASLRRGGEVDEEVFRGTLEDLDGALVEGVLRARATRVFEDPGELLDALVEPDGAAAAGVYLLERGDLELPELVAAGPVAVVAGGSLVVAGPVQGAGGPVTLVSLNGDVRVETDEPVAAHLVALRGRVTSRGALVLTGAVAAETLDLRELVRGGAPKAIQWDPALDPTDPAAYRARFAVHLDSRVHLEMEGH
jgi:hypothetical protein